LDPLYQSQVDCPCCETTFEITKVRPSFKNPSKVDSDFCGYYKHGTNPDYYVVRICSKCGFAFTENSFERLTEEQKQKYFQEIGKHWTTQYFHGERTIEQALISYKRSLMIGQLLGASHSVIAGILHHIAWLYRYSQDEHNEQKFLQFALDRYIVVYELEDNSDVNARLLFIIGELYNRTKQYSDAVKWFSRVVNDKRIMDAGMIRASREQWKEIGEKLAAERENTIQ